MTINPAGCLDRARERGMALVWVTASLLVVAGVVFSGIERMHAHEVAAENDFAVQGHAYGVARAGLVDALAWMRRNPTQPVLEFAPALDLDAADPVDQTDNPALGLVRTFEISPGLWGRYVVRRGRPMDPFTDLNGNGLYDDGEPFTDLVSLPTTTTTGTGSSTTGSAWIDTNLASIPLGFTQGAAAIVSAWHDAVAALQITFVDTTTNAYKQAEQDLRTGFESQLIALGQTFGVPPGHAVKTLDGAPVAVVEPDAGLGDGEWTPALWTRDIGAERGLPMGGTVWRIESTGTVYRMSDADQPLGQGPNRIMGRSVVATEVRRLSCAVPAAAAICARTGGSVTIGSRARVRAESLAVAVGASANGLTVAGSGEIIAPTSISTVPDYGDSIQDIFSVGWPELRSMSDVTTTADRPYLLRQIDPYALVTVSGDVVFDVDMPLKGKGILAVEGNLTIDAGSRSFFTGVLYVEGDLTIRAPAYIQGTIICTGTVRLEGTTGDFVDVEHDPTIVGDLLTVMGQYRITRAVYVPHGELMSMASAADLAAADPATTPDTGSTDAWGTATVTTGTTADTTTGTTTGTAATTTTDTTSGTADWWKKKKRKKK